MINHSKKYHLGILATHPIQYYVTWYKALAKHPEIDLKVFYCHRQTPEGQAHAGFGVPFEWDIPLFEGYAHQFLDNKARHPNVSSFFGCDTPEIKEIIYKEDFDAFIVHGWYVKSFWQAIIACWQIRTPIMIRGDSQLLTGRFLIKQWIKYPAYRWFIPKFDAYLVVGRRAKEYYLYYGADEKKMFFVPHCVDNNFFASNCAKWRAERDSLRERWKIPQDAMVFLFAGKLIPKKRPFDFLKALNLARKGSSKIYGLIVGDGPLRYNLENFTQKNNLSVTFTGFLNQSEMPKSYAVSDVLVLPSDGRETWGLIVNEAMACRLPAIVSDKVGCVPDLIHIGKTGNVFQCGNVERLKYVIENFAENKHRLTEMDGNVRKIIENYSINSAIDGTIRAIHGVIKNDNNI